MKKFIDIQDCVSRELREMIAATPPPLKRIIGFFIETGG